MSLAWRGRGSGEALLDYLPAAYRQSLPDGVTVQRLKDLLARITAVPLPPALQDLVRSVACRVNVHRIALLALLVVLLVMVVALRLPPAALAARLPSLSTPRCSLAPRRNRILHCLQLDRVVKFLSAELDALLPPVSAGFWALLMVLAAAAFVPFAAGRAYREFGKGVIVAIAMVFLSSMFVFGSLLPTLGEHLFWSEVGGAGKWANACVGFLTGQGAVHGWASGALTVVALLK